MRTFCPFENMLCCKRHGNDEIWKQCGLNFISINNKYDAIKKEQTVVIINLLLTFADTCNDNAACELLLHAIFQDSLLNQRIVLMLVNLDNDKIQTIPIYDLVKLIINKNTSGYSLLGLFHIYPFVLLRRYHIF